MISCSGPSWRSKPRRTQAPLAGSHELALALHAAVEEGAALEDRSERGRGLGEVVVQLFRLSASTPRDERGVRPVPALHDLGAHLGRADEHAVERGARHLAQPAAAWCLAVRGEARGRAGGVEDPERARRCGCELDEEREGQLGRDGRRKLGELLARQRTPEDGEGRRFGRQLELLGGGRHRGPRLARLESVLDGHRGDRVAEEVERGALTPPVGQAPRSHLAGAERGTQVAWKESCACGPRLSGADRRRTGDQLRRQRRTNRRNRVCRSVHSFHSTHSAFK